MWFAADWTRHGRHRCCSWCPKLFSESKGPATAPRWTRPLCARAGQPVEPQRHSGVYRMRRPGLHLVRLYRPVHDLCDLKILKFARPNVAPPLSAFRAWRVLSFVGGWFGDRFPQRWVIAFAFVCFAAVTYSMYNVATTFRAQCFLYLVHRLLRQRLCLHEPALDAATQCTAVHGRPRLGHLSRFCVRMPLPSLATRWARWSGVRMGNMRPSFELTLLPVIGIIAMVLIDPKQLIVPKKS